MKTVRIPQNLDAPVRVLLWRSDELAPLLIGLVAGIVASRAFICTLIGLLVTKAYRKYRLGRPEGYFLHALYWFGFLPSRAKSVPNPYIRRYLP